MLFFNLWAWPRKGAGLQILKRQVRFLSAHSIFMITDTEIQHIAQLTRIKLADKEKDKFKKELSLILSYVNKLNELDTDKVEPIYQVTGLVNALRTDEHRKDFEMDENLNEKLIGQAPHRQDRFVKVKSVLKK